MVRISNNFPSFAVMINFEDHIKISSMNKDPMKAITKLQKLLTKFEKNNGFSQDVNLGYLTTSPENVGTGMQMKA
jgi:protein arginine kinase